MIIVKIIGGLGNQMFQYAFGRSLAAKYQCQLKLDVADFADYKLHKYALGQLNVQEDFASADETSRFLNVKNRFLARYFPQFSGNKVIIESVQGFSAKAMESGDNAYLNGYWQSEKYFLSAADGLRREFTLKGAPSAVFSSWLDRISAGNSVSLHVRRGDYVNNEKFSKIYLALGMDYYGKAADIIGQKIIAPNFFIFSDDLDWARSNLRLDGPRTFVNTDKSLTNAEELMLMSRCRHNIIANSSYSWWGAWLNDNSSKIVVAPDQWTQDKASYNKDLIPASWIRL